MAYIKTHSNYVLKKRHKYVNDNRTIFERDITTIGGLDHYTAGQIPVYKSGNFIITVNNENNSSRKIEHQNWVSNERGDVWTYEDVSQYYVNNENVTDTNNYIELKKDYYKLTDFAYYGSLSKLVETSLADIINKFPGELYFGGFAGVSGDTDVDKTDELMTLHYTAHSGDTEYSIRMGGEDYYLVSNPFGINIHSTYVSDIDITDPLKYFVNDMYETYEVIDSEGNASAFTYDGISYRPPYDYLEIDESNSTDDSVVLVNTHEYLSIRFYYEKDGVVERVVLGPGESKTIEGASYTTEVTYTVDEHTEFFTVNLNTYLPAEHDFDVVSEKIYEIAGITIYGDEFVVCKGDIIGHVYINIIDDDENIVCRLKIYAIVGDDYDIFYFMKYGDEYDNMCEDLVKYGYHIRPKSYVFNSFIQNLTTFEKVLMNLKSEPRYKATFEVTTETDDGYLTRLESFIYPVGLGGYNIGSYGDAYNSYVSSLVELSAYYDEYMTDNLYRAMTHEAIKNMDWTARKDDNRRNEKTQEGGDRISSFIRIAGAEFDIVKDYIANIENQNTVTYNQQSNLPDYFLTDTNNLDGWDIKLTYPYSLTETVGTSGITSGITIEDEFENEYLGEHIKRHFVQEIGITTKPYSVNNITEEKRNGYFIACDGCSSASTVFDVQPRHYEVDIYGNEINTGEHDLKYDVKSYIQQSIPSVIPRSGNSLYYYDECKNVTRNLIQQYSNEVEYTSSDANLEFLRRLKINSRYILRHKGTYEGVEMLLSLFGMRSKRWYDSLPDIQKERFASQSEENPCFPYDFEIKEYSMFTPRIEDSWYKKVDTKLIEWCNSSKLIGYPQDVIDDNPKYTGLPVIYYEDPNAYLTESGVTTNIGDMGICRDTMGNMVHATYIYPYFRKDASNDGNPYYQMRGGWQNVEPIRFDKNDNILCRKHSDLYRETIQNTKKVGTLEDLLSLPIQRLSDGEIYYVENISEDYGVVDGKTYGIYYDDNGNKYMRFELLGGSVSIGDQYYSDAIVVSNPYHDDNVYTYVFDGKGDGFEVRVYIIDGEITVNSVTEENGSISTFTLFENGTTDQSRVDNATNYFKIVDRTFASEMSTNGWNQIFTDDRDYYILNSSVDYFNGNNPHNGKLKYDSGHEYLTYFNELFKYANAQNLMDTTCFDDDDMDYLASLIPEDYEGSIYSENRIKPPYYMPFGFTNLISTDPTQNNYDQFLDEDSKIHYFGNFYTVSGNPSNLIYYFYDEYDANNEFSYKITEIEAVNGDEKSAYGSNLTIYGDHGQIDNRTEQIVNTKRVELRFFLKSNPDTEPQEYLKEIKYLQCVVVPYVEQMIPASAILSIKYIKYGEVEYIGKMEITQSVLSMEATTDVSEDSVTINVRSTLSGKCNIRYKTLGPDTIATSGFDFSDIDVTDRTKLSCDEDEFTSLMYSLPEIFAVIEDNPRDITCYGECKIVSLTFDGHKFYIDGTRPLTVNGSVQVTVG